MAESPLIIRVQRRDVDRDAISAALIKKTISTALANIGFPHVSGTEGVIRGHGANTHFEKFEFEVSPFILPAKEKRPLDWATTPDGSWVYAIIDGEPRYAMIDAWVEPGNASVKLYHAWADTGEEAYLGVESMVRTITRRDFLRAREEGFPAIEKLSSVSFPDLDGSTMTDVWRAGQLGYRVGSRGLDIEDVRAFLREHGVEAHST